MKQRSKKKSSRNSTANSAGQSISSSEQDSPANHKSKKNNETKEVADQRINCSYTVFFLSDLESGGYTVHIPAFDMVTEGETIEEAQEMARDAIESRIAVLEELGQPIPTDEVAFIARIEVQQ